MKKFKFRLQRVIEVRETKEKEAQRELSQSMEELKRREEQLKREQEESYETIKGLKSALNSKISVAQLLALNDYRSWKEKVVEIQENMTELQKMDVNQKRKSLIQASMDKKVLERLKEKRLSEHQEQQKREEQSFLDELGGRKVRFDNNPLNNNKE